MKKKMEFLSQANLDVSHALFVSLNWSAPTSSFTSLLFHVQLKQKKQFFPKHEDKTTSIWSLRRHGIIYNHGLNKVANRFGILNYLSAYNNNKIILENVGKSFCSLNSGSWLLAPGSWFLTPDTMFPYGGNRCLKMRAPFKDVGRLQHVNCATTVAEIILSMG